MDLEKKYEELIDLVNTYLPSRSEVLIKMYESFQDRLLLAPASSYKFFHNAFPGGFIDHTLRVTHFALKLHEYFKEMELDTSAYTEENLVFVALHHDFGKMGFPGEGNEMYLPNNNEWYKQNRGKIYETNTNIPFVLVPDLSLYLLQHYKIPMNWEEYVAIKIHDGMYEEANKAYFMSRFGEPKIKSNLPYLIHMADLLACRKEISSVENSGVNMNYGKRAKAGKLEDIATKQDDPKVLAEFNSLFK